MVVFDLHDDTPAMASPVNSVAAASLAMVVFICVCI
jgi:hypothetical protein